MTDDDRVGLLSALVGEQLAAVVFLRDHVRFDFAGPRLAVFVWPVVTAGGVSLQIGDAGYRDALCDLVGRRVVAASTLTGPSLVIDLGRGRLSISPEPEDCLGPEIAHLDGIDGLDGAGRWAVWRPGEPPFVGPRWHRR